MSEHKLRIIGGKYKGRKIPVATQPTLRPTPNRVRETLFNWLQFDLLGLNTLDLFAGSGALSYEALSRGAEHVTLVEKDKAVFLELKKSQCLFDEIAITVVHASAKTFLAEREQLDYQLIFLDPPFATKLLASCLEEMTGKVLPGTLIYIESEKEITELPFKAECLKAKKASEVYFSLFKALT